MEILNHIGLGISVALQPTNIIFCFIGTVLGTVVGILPGLGPITTLAMLLPITLFLPPTPALIMLAGIYYGAQYGGSTTAILINVPGESTAVVTCLDGYAMAQQGRAGPALTVAALGSLFAGTVATLVIFTASPPLGQLALDFGSVEYFSLMVLGLTGAIVLAHGSIAKAVAMTLLGLFLGFIGTDVTSGEMRLTFGVPELMDGISFLAIGLGLFGFAEIVSNLDRRHNQPQEQKPVIGRWLPTGQEFRAAAPAVLRGTVLGSILGVLPGGGALLSSFAAYGLEKKIASDPSRFGRGAIEGVAAPEAANNAGAQTSFIPMLTLGIPSNPIMALMMGALMIQGIAPGPRVMADQPELFWGLIASMWVGNLMLVVLNLPLIPLWVRLLSIPYRLLFPTIVVISAVGVYAYSLAPFDVLLLALFGAVGYLFSRLGCEPTPLVLGFILGPMMEDNLRRSLLLSRGDPLIFVQYPISLGLLAVAALLLVATAVPRFRRTRTQAFVEEA